MITPSFLTEKNLKMLTNAGLGLVAILIFGYLLIYEEGYQTKKLDAMAPTIQTLEEQHDLLAPKVEEGNRIQCAACWNLASDTSEIKRCNCSPDK